MSTQIEKRLTLEEYFELDSTSEEKLEYWEGNVWSMSGGSLAHNQIVRNTGTEFDIELRGHDCQVLPSDMRIKVPSYPPYRYPDLTALCGPPEIERIGGLDVLVNPTLIVEVLSVSTEAFDRGDKFGYYKSIPTFQEYLLIAQHRPYVSHLWKQGDGSWILNEFTDLTDVVRCKSVPCELSLSAIYRGVDFERDAEKPKTFPLLAEILSKSND
jgi:Uma2 family endonuclease